MASTQRVAGESYTDVLVIGAGPAGLIAANALSILGVNVRIVDKRAESVHAGQADGIQPRTIEVFQSYGLAERLMKEGAQMHTVAFYNPGADGIEMTDRVPDITAPSARYPFEVTLHQGAVQNIISDSMNERGVYIEFQKAPESIVIGPDAADETAYPVKVTMRKQDAGNDNEYGATPTEEGDVEVVNAKFVLGSDGAHSWVRKHFGITMDGEQTDHIWGVFDITPDTDFPDIRNRTIIHSDRGSAMLIPREGDKVRFYIELNAESTAGTTVQLPQSDSDGRIDKSAIKVAPQQLLEVAQNIFHPYTIQPVNEHYDWHTIYIIGQRVASQFSVQNRVFIAGDACHTHSPKAGQGMNASMADSHNLAWKLAGVLKGWAKFSILDTYSQERRTFAKDLISFDKRFSSMFSGKKGAENEAGVSHEDFLKIFQTFGGFTSGIGIHYAPSPLIDTTFQTSAKNLVIGQRITPRMFRRAADYRPVEIQDLLPSDGRFKLLVFLPKLPEDALNGGCLEHYYSANETLALDLQSCLDPFSSGENLFSRFEVLTVATSWTRKTIKYNRFPQLFRSHWSKLLINDDNDQAKEDPYGIVSSGAVVAVRPDGYVGTVAPLHELGYLTQYFSGFMSNSSAAMEIIPLDQ